MLIDRDTFKAYRETVEHFDLEIEQDDESITIIAPEGQVIIHAGSGFIDHFSVPHNAKNYNKIIEFSIFLSNKISDYPRGGANFDRILQIQNQRRDNVV